MEKKRRGITPKIWAVMLMIACTFGCTVPKGTTPRVATVGGWCGVSINTHNVGVEYDENRGTTCQLEVGIRNTPENARYGMPRHAWTNLTLGGKVLGASPTEKTTWAGVHTQFEFLYVPEDVQELGPPEAQAREPKAPPPSEVPTGTRSVPPLAATTWPWGASEVAPRPPAETPPPPEVEGKPESSDVPEALAPPKE